MIWTIPFIAVCWLLVSVISAQSADQCRFCHSTAVSISGVHSGLACRECHQQGSNIIADPGSRSDGSSGCVNCHRGYGMIYQSAMGTRAKERSFIARTYRVKDRGFEKKNCSSCHLQGCRDCHGNGHAITRPGSDICSKCHKGYYVGWDYLGRAPREEHDRYQRGKLIEGETFLKMLPDVHHQRGISCGECHSMQSMVAGKSTSRTCTDCHQPSRKVLEHRIGAHLEKMECVACHAAWGAQEYGTFYLHFSDGHITAPFDQLTITSTDYVKSVYIKRQDLPPLGVNSSGKVAPIRPQYIAYYSRMAGGRAKGVENQLLAAEWRVFAPHTIQKGTAVCDGCHDNPRRFLLEEPGNRIYDLQKDGMGLLSFWSRTGQRVVNGSFLEAARYRRLSFKSDTYKRVYVQKWKQFLNQDAVSLPR